MHVIEIYDRTQGSAPGNTPGTECGGSVRQPRGQLAVEELPAAGLSEVPDIGPLVEPAVRNRLPWWAHILGLADGQRRGVGNDFSGGSVHSEGPYDANSPWA